MLTNWLLYCITMHVWHCSLRTRDSKVYLPKTWLSNYMNYLKCLQITKIIGNIKLFHRNYKDVLYVSLEDVSLENIGQLLYQTPVKKGLRPWGQVRIRFSRSYLLHRERGSMSLLHTPVYRCVGIHWQFPWSLYLKTTWKHEERATSLDHFIIRFPK